ncbi:hypothetical protein [Deinococcus knuensis]|uniref:DUF2202 domain-containing protein n=1 Tax=Deinococcus knuensis TaxID=1837380 RepID=A0ABQ2SEL8_9DEIO|nr:hypothetical protein [Deinococcus knuensis]GGS25707.1 hypothetical protein GCM10008961_16490 [Deinococcus knuensis]
MIRTAALPLSVTALLASSLAFALTPPAAPATVNTDAERAAWEALMSPDGEYAAIAAYSAVIARYGQVEPYVSILRAEENHARALSRQLQRYGVAVPTNPYLGRIPAPPNLRDAAQAWADGEVLNVKMYDDLASLAAGDTALQRVFDNLRSASLNVHLPLFRQAATAGGTLTAGQMNGFHVQNSRNR